MKKKKIFTVKNSCVIIGAGASKGALFDTNETPPLDSEFLNVADKLFSGRIKATDTLKIRGKSEWTKLKGKLNGIGINTTTLTSWRLETLATYLEARIHVHFENERGRPTKYSDALDSLKRIVCYVLALTNGTRKCEIHQAIIAHINPKTIISFNYDLIIDQTLLAMDRLNWASQDYSKAKTVETYKNNKFTKKKWYLKRRPSITGIQLYKLHGSIHWQELKRTKSYSISGIKCFPPIVSKEKNTSLSFDYLMPPHQPYLIPPVAAKTSIKDIHMGHLWSKAHKALKKSPVWIIWGYSFPQTDTITTVLLRTCLAKARKSKKRIIIINPDKSVGIRVKSILSKVTIEQYDTALDYLIREGFIKIKDIKTTQSN